MAKKDLTFYNRKERPWLNRLDRSAIVGHTTATNTKLWFRLKKQGNYQVVISQTPLRGLVSAAPTLKGDDWVVKNDPTGKHITLFAVVDFDVTGATDFTFTLNTELPAIKRLVPDFQAETCYYYGVFNRDDSCWELGIEKEHCFTTLPQDGNGPWDVAFGLYSCHMPFDPNCSSKADASMWGIMEEELRFNNARFVIGGGDQVYVDGTDYLNIWAWLKKIKKEKPTIEDMKSWYRDIYRGYWGFPNVKAVHRHYPNYMIWDDHEIMDGWGSYTKEELSDELDSWFEWEDEDKNVELANKMFKAAKHAYLEYQHCHNPTTPKNQYDYTLEQCGADYFFLDMRGVRNFENKQNGILGADQLRRLSKWIENLSAEKDGPIFVVSTVPMVHLKDFVSDTLDWLSVFGARDDVRDHWEHDHHKDEFKTLLDLIFQAAHTTKRPLVVLSGDVHIGGVFELFPIDKDKKKKLADAKVYQVTSSAITYAALGPLKMSLLSKGVARKGTVGTYKENGKEKNSGYGFRNHFIFPQYNFSIIRYRTDGEKTQQILVDFVGQSEDHRVKESKRMDLLRL